MLRVNVPALVWKLYVMRQAQQKIYTILISNSFVRAQVKRKYMARIWQYTTCTRTYIYDTNTYVYVHMYMNGGRDRDMAHY